MLKVSKPSLTPPKENQVEVMSEPNSGAWMIVTRKKNSVRNGRARGTSQPPHQGGEVRPSTSEKQLIRTTQPHYV